jgi:hypothetical protein
MNFGDGRLDDGEGSGPDVLGDRRPLGAGRDENQAQTDEKDRRGKGSFFCHAAYVAPLTKALLDSKTLRSMTYSEIDQVTHTNVCVT